MEWSCMSRARVYHGKRKQGANKRRAGQAICRRKNRRGIALVWTALVLLVMIGMVGLAIDMGWAALDAHWLQNAGDAGSLAGAMLVKNAHHDGTLDIVYDAAQELTLANRAANGAVDVCFNAATNDPNLDVVVGRWFMGDHYFEPLDLMSSDVPNAVKVVTRHVEGWAVNQPLGLLFGPVFGVQTANVLRDAVAISTGGGGAALVCLAPEGVGLLIPGGACIYVNEGPVPGEIWVDSFWRTPVDKDDAVYPTPNSPPDFQNGWYIDCAALNTCGTVDPSIMEYFGGEPPNNLYPVLEKLPTPIPDPLHWLPALDVAAMNPGKPGAPYGMVVKVDPTTGIPLTDPDTGAYIPATHRESGQTFDVSAGNPIRSSTIDDFGQLVGGVRQTLTVTPGYYPGGFDQQNSGANFKTIRMLPGVYAVGGGSSPPGNSGLVLNGGALDAEGVMIYVTNSSLDLTGNWGHVDISGNYEYINLTEYVYLEGDPDYYRKYDYLTEGNAGMAMFQDRRNPREAKIVGGEDNMVMGGTLYFHCTGQEAGMFEPPDPVPAGTWDVTVEVGGTSGQTGIQLITDRVRVHGDSDLIIKYDGRNFQPANEALLVK